MAAADSAASESAAAIAARYGATVAPGVAVQVVPRGASARPLPVWVEGKGLVYPDLAGTCGGNWRKPGNKGGRGNPHAVAAKEARAPRLVALHAQGLSMPQISAALGVDRNAIRDQLRELGLTPHDGFAVRREQRLVRLRSLVAAGHSDRDIAELMDLTVKRVRAWAKEEGVTLRLAVPERLPQASRAGAGRPRTFDDAERKARKRAYARAAYARRIGRDPAEPSRDERAAARRAEVARLHAEGLSSTATARALNIAVRLVQEDRRHLGLGPTQGDAARRAELNAALAARNAGKDTAARRARVADLRNQGRSLPEIAMALNCAETTVSADIKWLADSGVVLGQGRRRPARWEADPTLLSRALVLHRSGLSQARVGAALGLPRATAKRLIRRALAAEAVTPDDRRAA